MRERLPRGTVIVGYDGRWQPPSVLEIGAKAAERFELPLSIVTLYRPVDDVASFDLRPLDGWNPLPAIRRTLHAAERLIRESHPDVRLSTHALCYDEVRRDVEPLRSGVLLVLGERPARAPEVPALRTASALLREATACHVVVVRESTTTPEPHALRPEDARTEPAVLDLTAASRAGAR